MDSNHSSSNHPVRSAVLTGAVCSIERGELQDRIQFINPHLARIRRSANTVFAPRRSWSPAPEDAELPTSPAVQFNQNDHTVRLTGDLFRIEIEKASGRLLAADGQGRVFFAEKSAPEPGTGGFVYSITTWPEQHFYGFGERSGLLEKTGHRMVNWTTDPGIYHGPGIDPMYDAIPVFMCVQPGLAYGLYLNNTFRSQFDLTHSGKLEISADGGELDYYLAFGPTPADVVEAMTGLLGRMPLPPLWALGYHQSRWSYMSEEQVREVAAQVRSRHIPCDVIHLDIDYMDGYRDFTWNPKTFSHPAALLADLRKQNFRVVPIIDAGIKADPGYEVYREGLEKDYFIRNLQGDVTHGYVWPDDSVFSDFTRPEVREWWGNLGKKLVDDGASGIWNDMNEPVTFSKPFSEGGSGTGTLPLDAQQGPPAERTTHAEAHNLYGSLMARSSYEGLRRHLKGERPFVLTRSAFAGVQRWSAVWMGDNSSWWEHLEMSIPQLMNMGLSGVAFVGADIGGFTENATPELFARWVEVGSLYPFCRGHSSAGTRWQEPWTFGSQVENIARMYLDLRYRLLPYLYTLLWQASETGSPAFRPLLYEFPDDPATYHLGDQFMLGSSLMAAPILRPGRMAREVYLPQGEWIDWWSGERFKGPATILAHAPLEIMPLYVRAGSILPFGPEIEYTGQKALDPLTLEIFPGQGEFTLYEDDGQSFDYQRGVFCTTRFVMQQEGAKLILSASPRQGAYHPAERTLEVHLHASAAARCEGHPEAHWKTRDRVLGLSLPDRGEGFCLTFTLE